MTNTTHPARVAPAAEAPLTEQISSLVTREMRMYLLGSVEADGARSEGVVIRTLLINAVEQQRQADHAEYCRRLALGEAELVARDVSRAARIAATGQQE
jgi:hypothetical protein